MQRQLEEYSNITLSQDDSQTLLARIRVDDENDAAELIRLCRVVQKTRAEAELDKLYTVLNQKLQVRFFVHNPQLQKSLLELITECSRCSFSKA